MKEKGDVTVDIRSLESIRRWFKAYVDGFYRECGRLHQLELKELHSRRVAENAALLADDMKWHDDERNTAVAAGLLHDLGRFPQYRDYGTFYDFRSIDHGDRGELAFREEFPMGLLSPREAKTIALCIREHNKKEIPEHISSEEKAYLRLIRDCDRIDIYRVVREHVQNGDVKSIYPGMGPEGSLTPGVLDDLLRDGKVRYDQLRTMSDVLLFQLCWIHDMAHGQSVRLLWDRGDLEWILDRIPDDPRGNLVVKKALERVSTAKGGV